MKRSYLVANWKMNVPPEGIQPYLRALSERRPKYAELVVAPPFVFIPQVARMANGTAVAAQNCGDQKSGAFTGEVSGSMLREAGARYAIVGHSERRNLYQENDALIGRRLAMAIENGLTPVLCVGEDLRVREDGQVARFLADQIRAVVSPSLDDGPLIIVAYEPVWAIGTGRNATGAMVAETVRGIRDALQRFWPERHAASAVLYGGSVTPENITDLWKNGMIDGFLVGGASLDSAKFLAIHDRMRA
jgi:triosephosphate isomerase